MMTIVEFKEIGLYRHHYLFCLFFCDVPLGRHIDTGKCQGDVFLEPSASSGPQTLIINMLTLNPF